MRRFAVASLVVALAVGVTVPSSSAPRSVATYKTRMSFEVVPGRVPTLVGTGSMTLISGQGLKSKPPAGAKLRFEGPLTSEEPLSYRERFCQLWMLVIGQLKIEWSNGLISQATVQFFFWVAKKTGLLASDHGFAHFEGPIRAGAYSPGFLEGFLLTTLDYIEHGFCWNMGKDPGGGVTNGTF